MTNNEYQIKASTKLHADSAELFAVFYRILFTVYSYTQEYADNYVMVIAERKNRD